MQVRGELALAHLRTHMCQELQQIYEEQAQPELKRLREQRRQLFSNVDARPAWPIMIESDAAGQTMALTGLVTEIN